MKIGIRKRRMRRREKKRRDWRGVIGKQILTKKTPKESKGKD